MHTLAYGHYAITRKVNDVTPIERADNDMVLSAEQAATARFRPGRPWPHLFPLGEEPVAAATADGVARADALQDRLNTALERIHNNQLARTDKDDEPLVNSLINSVYDENFQGAIDRDFDPDDIVGLFDAAKNFRDTGASRDELKAFMLALCAILREMYVNERNDLVDGEVEVDADE